MEKQELDNKITNVAKTLLSYCAARTANQFEAEDLAHDIILELYKSVDALRDENAFYGFLWAVAKNVYKNWCKNKAKNKQSAFLDTPLANDDFVENENSNLFLLRRELTLLTEKYRKAVILYYIENMSCVEISNVLSISESMVKYLLFKSRKILKEGINMERNYGHQSYNPQELTIAFWGNDINRYSPLGENRISQNILFACYNNKLSAEQISLEIGVALPYMEDKLNELLEYELIKKDGNRYYTNIVIFTEDFTNEVTIKTMALRERIADILKNSIAKHEQEIRAIGFVGCTMKTHTLRWQMVSLILRTAIIDILQKKINVHYPKDKFGVECFVWGIENGNGTKWLSQFGFGVSNVTNTNGDCVQFTDFPINGEAVHQHYFNRQNVTNVFLDIAKGDTAKFSENDRMIVSELIRKGYVLCKDAALAVNVPVFTQDTYSKLKELFSSVAEEIANEAEALTDLVGSIVKNHVPVHLKKFSRDMAYLRLFEDAIAAPVSILCEKNYLLPYNGNDFLPTTYIILK